MRVSVLDASALAALAFAEPSAEDVVAALGESRIAAPALVWFEVANVCATKMRAHPDRRPALRDAFALATTLPIDIVEVDPVAVVGLADETGLTAYDASYLWLARQLGARLVTLDRKLARAMEMGG